MWWKEIETERRRDMNRVSKRERTRERETEKKGCCCLNNKKLRYSDKNGDIARTGENTREKESKRGKRKDK